MTGPGSTPSTPQVLRQIWRQQVPGGVAWVIGQLRYAPNGIGIGVATIGPDSLPAGSVAMIDPGSGAVTNQVADDFEYLALAFSPDSSRLATSQLRRGDGLQQVVVRDATNLTTQHCVYEKGPTGILQLEFSPDGISVLCIAVEGVETIVSVFNAGTGIERWRQSLKLGGGATFSPTGQFVAAYDGDKIVLFDAMSGAIQPATMTTSDGQVEAVAFSPDGRWIIASGGSKLFVFDASTGASPPNSHWPVTLPSQIAGVLSIAVSDDAQWVAVVFDIASNTVGLYNIADGTPRFAPVQLGEENLQIAYSPTLRHVLVFPSGSFLHQPDMHLLDARSGEVVATRATSPSDAVWSPDGASIACYADATVESLDVGVELARSVVPTDGPTAISLTLVAMSHADSPLVAVADTGARVTVLDAATGALLAGPKPVPGIINAIAFADNDQAIVCAASSGLYFSSIVGAHRWELTSSGPVNAVASVGADGQSLAIATGNTAQLHTTAAGDSIWTHAHPQLLTRIAASPNGKWVATGGMDRITRILDAQNGGQEMFASAAGDGRVEGLAFQPGTSVLGSANEDGRILLIDADDHSRTGLVTRNSPCRLIAFSADPTTPLLAVADDTNTIGVYDVSSLASPQLIQQLKCTAPITALAFNRADSSLATATGQTTVTVHDPRAGGELQRIVHPQPVRQFAIGDAALLTTICDDQTVRTWRT
jgi:WD40 repeat protein